MSKLEIPEVGSYWAKRYPVFNECIVRVTEIDTLGPGVGFGDDDGNDTVTESWLSVAQFNADYKPLPWTR
jgi:hypothetical protein